MPGPHREDWSETLALLRAGGDPLRSPHLGAFYAMAVRDGERMLASFRQKLDEERIRDLIHDLLAERLREVIEAKDPRALFCVALQRRAISWLRRGDAVVEEPPPASGPTGEAADIEEERRAFLIDASRALLELSQRDRDIVAAVAWGEDREEIAQRHGTTRPNVDQIVSRAHRRFRGGES